MSSRRRHGRGTSRGRPDPKRPSGPQRQPDRNPLASFGLRAALLVLLLLIASALTFDPKLYINGDNVDYILLAQRALRDGDLWASPKYPPLFPLLLVPVQLFFGSGFLAAKVFMVLLYAACGPWLLALAERALRPGWAFAATAGALTMLPLVEFSHYVMSEIPFVLAGVMALHLSERALDRLPHRKAVSPETGTTKVSLARMVRVLAPAVLVAGIAFYIRTAGIALLAALPLVLLLKRRWRAMLWTAVMSAVVLVPWVLHAVATHGEGETYLDQIRYINPYAPSRGMLDLSALGQRLLDNVQHYFGQDIILSVLPYAYNGTYAASSYPPPVLPLGVALAIAVLLALSLAIARRWLPVTTAYTALFLIVCLSWPPIWASIRFVLPVLPLCFLLLVIGAVKGGVALSERRPALGRSMRIAPAALLAVILLLAGHKLVRLAHEVKHYPTRWEAYFTALEWAKTSLPRDVVVLDRKPNIFGYVTGLEAVSFPREEDDQRMIEHLRQRGVDVIHVSSIPYDDVLKILHPFVQRQAALMEPIWYEAVDGGGYSAFLRFKPEP